VEHCWMQMMQPGDSAELWQDKICKTYGLTKHTLACACEPGFYRLSQPSIYTLG